MKDNRPILVELQYLPPLEYFILLMQGNTVLLDAHEHYEKQTYRNRAYIKGPHRTEKLTVPVTGGSKKVLTSEIEIDYRQKWLTQHWRSLQTAYGKSPYFEHYGPLFLEIYESRPKKLWELNFKLLTLCLKLLQIETTIGQTDSYLQSTNPAFLDFRSGISPKKSTIVKNNSLPGPYNQIFGKDFVYNLSVADLLFCEGPAGKLILHESAIPGLNN